MSKARVITVALAIVLGVGAAWIILPALSRHRALNGITHTDLSERRAGWTWLLVRGSDGLPRAVTLVDRINDALADAHDEALLDGASVLRENDLWEWGRQSNGLILREMTLRASVGDAVAVAGETLDAPLDLDGELLLPLVNQLLQSDVGAARQTAFVAACGWAGPDRGHWLARLKLRPDDTPLRRAQHLVAGWCNPALPPDSISLDAAPEVVDAVLLRSVRISPENAALMVTLATHATEPPPVVTPDVLRYSRDPEALRVLQRLAKEGNRGARYALQTRSANRDETQARLVIDDPAQPIGVRRLAAWRWDGAPSDSILELLAAEPADADGAVYATALLAERRLAAPAAAAQAEAWIRSFNDDEKCAGALLSALLGVHAELLEEAIDLEDIPRVRTIQRLALAALGVEIGSEDLDEFGFRVLHRPDGTINPDTLLCLLAAGRLESLAFLTRRPAGTTETLGRAVQKQAWLIERFVPIWHEATGRPIGSSVRGLRLYFDELEAARMLMFRRMEFDRVQRTFAPRV